VAQIERTTDSQGKPSFNYRTTLELLADELVGGRCLVFLGAGASVDPERQDLPTATELSKGLAERCSLQWHEYVPLSTIAFYYEFFFSRANLNSFLLKRIGNPQVQPSSTVKTLIEIVKCLEQRNVRTNVITTNYDRHFEVAYQETFNRPPGVVVYNGAVDPNAKRADLHVGLDIEDSQWWTPTSLTTLYKMHGCISDAGERNLVITEEDYINFLTNALSQDEKKRLLHYVRGRIALSTVLFVGYSLADWNFRVIFKATAEEKHKPSYAVQLNKPPLNDDLERTRQAALLKFWGDKKVDIINTEAARFMQDLLEHVRAA
jgi:hypothetical protein